MTPIEAPNGYLVLDVDLERQMHLDRVNDWRNPHAFQDADIVRRTPGGHDEATLVRPAFVRDIEKVLHIPAYNRYAGKTQVFSFAENDDICRRGLHVQLVNRVARTIGGALRLNCDLIEAIALGHDLGHTPFGHAGERFLSALYHEQTGRYFNHNVHSVRVMDVLFPRNISLQVLDGALCHNGEFAQQTLVMGDTRTFDQLDALVEACNADESNIATLRPSTLEGCVVRVADMIAYLGKDRADALSVGAISGLDMFESQMIGVDNSHIINNMTVDIIEHSYRKDRISMSEEAFADIKLAKQQNSEIIYKKEGMIKDTSNVVEDMFARLYEKLLADVLAGNESSPIFKHHVSSIVTGSRSITAEQYAATEPNLLVVDYIASMTDAYFMALYEHLFPTDDVQVYTRTYCADL